VLLALHCITIKSFGPLQSFLHTDFTVKVFRSVENWNFESSAQTHIHTFLHCGYFLQSSSRIHLLLTFYTCAQAILITGAPLITLSSVIHTLTCTCFISSHSICHKVQWQRMHKTLRRGEVWEGKSLREICTNFYHSGETMYLFIYSHKAAIKNSFKKLKQHKRNTHTHTHNTKRT